MLIRKSKIWLKKVIFASNLILYTIEKAVFNCLEDDEGEYEELEDDFLFLANEGKPALVAEEISDDEKEKEMNGDFHNKGVIIIKDELEE